MITRLVGIALRWIPDSLMLKIHPHSILQNHPGLCTKIWRFLKKANLLTYLCDTPVIRRWNADIGSEESRKTRL